MRTISSGVRCLINVNIHIRNVSLVFGGNVIMTSQSLVGTVFNHCWSLLTALLTLMLFDSGFAAHMYISI
jgi:hypothetical protein